MKLGIGRGHTAPEIGYETLMKKMVWGSCDCVDWYTMKECENVENDHGRFTYPWLTEEEIEHKTLYKEVAHG